MCDEDGRGKSNGMKLAIFKFQMKTPSLPSENDFPKMVTRPEIKEISDVCQKEKALLILDLLSTRTQ